MDGRIPSGKLRRGLIGGKTAAKVGAKVANYLVKRPFLSPEAKRAARKNVDEAAARDVFACLCNLKGTALKIAQLFSMEMEMVPEAVRKELEKSYNQVPPMNRVLANKAAANALKEAPGEVFGSFSGSAFAAASLGQVHEATAPGGEPLAVKIQYPGISRTILDDMRLVKGILGRLPDARHAIPILDEIEARLLEETDYLLEAENMAFFKDNLLVDGVRVPEPWEPGCSQTILSATHMPGLPLNRWLETSPGRRDRNTVAKRLNDIFLESLYGLGRIHADPNPGNYIIGEDLTVSLVDFGCVKTLSPEFIEQYSKLPGIIMRGDKTAYFAMMRSMNMLSKDMSKETEEEFFEAAYSFGRWLARLFEAEYFDFAKETNYIGEGREHSRAMLKFRKYLSANPEFVFLDRTRYGLLRIFEKLQCRIKLRNQYEMTE